MVGSTTNRISYNVTSASTAPLAVDYRFDDSSWLQVRYVETGAETSQLLTIGTHYTVSGDGTAIEGAVTLTSGFLDTITSGELVIARFTPAFQEVNLEYNTRFPAVSVENQMDETVMALQDRTDSDFQAGSRAIYLPPNEPASNPNTLPLPIFRAGKFFAFNSDTGAIEALSAEDAAIRILAYYGLEITSEDVLATISALAPIERFTPPTTSTEGLFGQLAIIPEHVDLEVTGTLTPDITGTLLPWKTENGKIWFSTDGVDPATLTSTPLSVSIGWNGTRFGISVYEYGIEPVPAKGWLALNGNSSTYPDNVTSWLTINTTGQPDITTINQEEARLWVNAAPSDTPPNWQEIQMDRPRNSHFYIGDSIMGPLYGFWGDDMIALNASYHGARQIDLATPGAALYDIQFTLESSLSFFGRQPESVLTQVFIGTAINDAGQPALSVSEILDATINCATIAKQVLGDHVVVTVFNMPSRSSQDARALEYNALLAAAMPSSVIDFVFDLYTLAPDIEEGVHQSELGNQQIAEELNNVLLGSPTEVPGTISLPVKTSQAISSIGTGNPSPIAWTAHGMQTGDFVELATTNSTPVVDGIHQITRIDANSFSIPVNVTVAGTTGTINKGIARIATRIPYNVQNTWRVYSHNDNAGGGNTEVFDATNGWSAGGKYEFILKSLGWFANGFGESSPIFEGVATNYDGGTATLSLYFKNKSTSFSYKLYSTRTGGGLLP